MNLKAIIQKIALWFKSEAKEVEQDLETRLREIESAIPTWKLGAVGTIAIPKSNPRPA